MKRLLILSAILATAACSSPAEPTSDLAVVSVTGAI
jgi:hypothetical protein